MLNPPRKLSQDPVYKNLLLRDRLVVLRSPLDELDPAQRNGTASLDTVAAALAPRLPANYLALSLDDAQALPLATPPGVVRNTLYGITGNWNATGTDKTVYLHGVRDDAFHRLGFVYDAPVDAQLVQVDVAAGTYKKLSGQTLYDVLGSQTDGAPTNRLLRQVTDSKADLVSGRVPVAQSRDVGYGLELDQNGSYALKDGALFYYRPTQLNRRINPATGAVVTSSAATGYELTQTIATTAPALPFVTPGQRYQSTVPLFYAAWYNSFNQYVGPWSASTTDASFFSTAPAGANYLKFSVPTGKVDGPPELRITPAGVGAYDDTALKARVTTLEGLGGRNRGPWAANTAYKQYDWVIYASRQYYAPAAFTSGANFDAANWLPVGSQASGQLVGSKTMWVLGGLASYDPQPYDQLRPYPTAQAAQAAAQEGDIIYVLPGGDMTDALGRRYYSANYTQTKNVRLIMGFGAIMGGQVLMGAYYADAPFAYTIQGGEFLGLVALCRQASGKSTLTLQNATISGLGVAQYIANNTNNSPHVDDYFLRDCRVDSQRANGTNGPVRNNGLSTFGSCRMVLDNTLVTTVDAPCVTYSAQRPGTIVLRGTTELRPGNGRSAYETLDTGEPGVGAVPQAEWLVDERLVRGGSPTPPATPADFIEIGREIGNPDFERLPTGVFTEIPLPLVLSGPNLALSQNGRAVVQRSGRYGVSCSGQLYVTTPGSFSQITMQRLRAGDTTWVDILSGYITAATGGYGATSVGKPVSLVAGDQVRYMAYTEAAEAYMVYAYSSTRPYLVLQELT